MCQLLLAIIIVWLQKMVSREVNHFWFTGWPDHGVPMSAKSVIEFLIHARGYIREMPGPTVVHCRQVFTKPVDLVYIMQQQISQCQKTNKVIAEHTITGVNVAYRELLTILTAFR